MGKNFEIKEERYIVIDENIDNCGDTSCTVCKNINEASVMAEQLWKHLTADEQKHRHVYVGKVTNDCLADDAVDDETGEIDWTAFNSLYACDSFDSNNKENPVY